MADNDFTKQELVLFDKVIEGFDDALVASRLINKYTPGETQLERSNEEFWRPMPLIVTSNDGSDATSNFDGVTDLSVPARIGFQKHVAKSMTAREANDAIREDRLGVAAMQRLGSDINVAVMNLLSNTSTIVKTKATAATGYDDLADIEAKLDTLGLSMSSDRHIGLTSRDYNNIASNLAARQTMQGKPTAAYERSYVGTVANMTTHKLDYGNRIAAAAGTSVTINGANQYYTPRATDTTDADGTLNVDNRYQTINLTVGGGSVAVGDVFTITGVNAVHHISKTDTDELKTFRIIKAPAGGGSGAYTISPPIISGGGGTSAELSYKNVTATPANGAAVNFLNVAAGRVNPFWVRDSVEIIPYKLALPTDGGMAVTQATSEQGLTVTMSKQVSIDTHKIKYRWDVVFGLVNLNPEMNGIALFEQT